MKIAILGIANSGKSTLVNKLINYKASIISPKPHTTREAILAILTENEKQLVFIDTPGISASNKTIERKLANIAEKSSENADLYIFLIDGKKKLQPHIINLINKIKTPKIAVINKIDDLNTSRLLPLTDELRLFIPEIFSISALEGYGIEDLIKILWEKCEQLPETNDFFEINLKTTRTEDQLIIDQTREAIFYDFNEEIPYQIEIETVSKSENSKKELIIHQNIFVKKSYKAIFLSKIKELSIKARRKIEDLLLKKVHLYLQIKVN